MRQKLIAAISVALFAVASSPVLAKPITARLATVFPAESPMGKANAKFAEKVKEATNGDINIVIYPDGQLGGDEVVGRELSRGHLEFSSTEPAAWKGINPMLDIHHLPYLITSYEMADKLVYPDDSLIHTILRDAMLKSGMRTLAFYELDFRGLSNSERPVNTVEDLRGLKLRVPPAAPLREFFKAAGAQGITLPFPELFVALQQGTVDGQDNGPSLTYSSGLYEAQKHMTLTNHSYGVASITVSEKFWQRLSPEQQEKIAAIARDVSREQIGDNRENVQKDVEKMRAAGLAVVELTDDQMATFRKVGRGVWDQFSDLYGEERLNMLKKEVAELER